MRRARMLLHHPIARNAAALYWVQIAGFVIPLVTLPYLARVLGPAGLGPVVAAQAVAMWLGTVIEYGFNLAATRDVARRRHDPGALASTVAGVLGAKVVLILASVVLVALARAVPVLRTHPDLLALAWVAAIAQGLYPLWFFQGIERLGLPALLELTGRSATAVLILVLVNGVGDGWVVLALQAGTGVLGTIIATTVMYKGIARLRPRADATRAALRSGWHLFLYNAGVSLYSSANVVVLGLFASGAQVGLYGGAEKLVRAAGRLMTPISQAVFPRMSFLVAQQSNDRARRLAWSTLAVLMGLAVVGTALLIVLAPLLVRVVFGPGFAGAAAVLRILALTIPLVALSNVLGQQWMLPLGMDRPFTRVILLAGLLNVALAAVLTPTFAAAGMAACVVAAEAFVIGGLAVAIRRAGGLPRGDMVPAPVGAPIPTAAGSGTAG